MQRCRFVRAWLLAFCLAAPLSVPAAEVTKTVDTSAQEKAKAELVARLTQRNLALRELARQVNAIPPTSPLKDALAIVRADLVAYQRANARVPDGTLGGLELQTLHASINSLLKAAASTKLDPASASAVAAMQRVQSTQLDARNARALMIRTQLEAIRAAMGAKGPVLLVPSKPLAPKPAATRMAAREGDATTTALDTTNDNTQPMPETVVAQITVTENAVPENAGASGTVTLPSGATVNASAVATFVATGGFASLTPTTHPNITIPTVGISVEGQAPTIFQFASTVGAFDQLVLPAYCNQTSGTTTSSSSSSYMTSVFEVSDDCGEPKTTTTSSTTTKPLSCPSGTETVAGLCYTKCRAGYEGHVTMCVKDDCPSGYSDQGLFCGKGAPYERGAGYPWKFGDKAFSLDGARARCQKDHGSVCEKNGEIIYPKCRSGYHAFGSNVCTPDCPSGYTDIGVSCKKPSYDRGAGVPKS